MNKNSIFFWYKQNISFCEHKYIYNMQLRDTVTSKVNVGFCVSIYNLSNKRHKQNIKL